MDADAGRGLPTPGLLWYFDHAHGSGPAYRVVTVTGVEDGAAWLRLAERMATGDLRSWARDLDGLQHESHGRILTATRVVAHHRHRWPTSPPSPASTKPTMYMEDTMWPFPGKVREYIEAAGAVYRPALGAEGSQVQLSIELALQTMPGAGRYPEVTLLQKLSSLPLLIRLLTNDIPPEVHRAGIVDARGPRPPRPVAEQAAPNGGVVAALMSTATELRQGRGGDGRCCSCMRPTG